MGHEIVKNTGGGDMAKNIFLLIFSLACISACDLNRRNAFSYRTEKLKPTGWESIELRYTADDPAKNISVRVTPRGGNNWYSFIVGTNELIYAPQALTKCPLYRDNRGCVLLYPTPNRVTDGKYRWNSREYLLKTRDDEKPRILHGILYDAEWKYRIVTTNSSSITLETWYDLNEDDPRFQAFPFSNQIIVRYSLLSDRLRVSYEVTNTGTVPFGYGFGLHPYFAVPGKKSGHVLFECDVPHLRDKNSKGIPAGGFSKKRMTGSYFYPAKPIEKEMFGVFHRANPGSKVSVFFMDLGLRLSMRSSSDFHYLILFKREKFPEFAAVEHQTSAPDAHNLYASGQKELSGLRVIHPQEMQYGNVDYIPSYEGSNATDR